MRARATKAYSGYNRRPYTDKEKAAFKLRTKKNLDAFYKNTAAKILESIKGSQAGAVLSSLALPFNPATGAVFTGANSWVLSQHMIENNLTDPRFVKGNQLYRLGKNVHILKDEQGIHILEPRKIGKPGPGQTSKELDDEGLSLEEQDAIFESTKGSEVIMFRPYSVFHASQINNMPAFEKKGTQDLQKNQLAERLIEACGIKLSFGSEKPSYTLHNDTIHMPGKRNFESPDAYASELLKQWYVATGSQAREGRFKGPSRISEGLLNQAAETLRAQTFAMVASKTFGLPYQLSVDPMHIKCWEKQLNEDPRHVVTQTAYATNLVNTVVDFAKEVQPKAGWFPDKSAWPSTSSDLDAQLNENMTEGQTIAGRIHEMVLSSDKGFTFDIQEGGSMQFACDLNRDEATGNVGEEDVIAAFEIRESLLREYQGLEVNVLEENGNVYLRIDSGPTQDLDPDPAP